MLNPTRCHLFLVNVNANLHYLIFQLKQVTRYLSLTHIYSLIFFLQCEVANLNWCLLLSPLLMNLSYFHTLMIKKPCVCKFQRYQFIKSKHQWQRKTQLNKKSYLYMYINLLQKNKKQ